MLKSYGKEENPFSFDINGLNIIKMNFEINVLKPEEIKDSLISFFKNNSLVPIVGAGFTCGLKSFAGEVPSGEDYKKHMIGELLKKEFSKQEKEDICSARFSTLCDFYEDDENVDAETRLKYLKSNFYRVCMPQSDIRSSFFDIEWPYIYTLNIDDAIENSSCYKKVIIPNDGLNDEIFLDEKCVIKLHGDIGNIVTYNKGSGKIFTSKDYAVSINENKILLNKLRNDYKTQNILFIGCGLDDEIDLKTLTNWSFDCKEKDTLSRTIIFIKGYPGKLQKSKYKTYGITDIVCFDSYDAMYHLLMEAWNEAEKIQSSDLELYNRIKIDYITAKEITENQDYFLWNKILYDLKKRTIRIPYYFISRNISQDLLNNIPKNKVHLIYGSRVSGKSYLLVDLYKTIRDRQVFYFDGRSRITQKALEELLLSNHIVALFDVGTLERGQFEYILQNARNITANYNNIIINVNNNDSDTLGIVKWKLNQHIIDSSDIITYNLNNRFKAKDEMLQINKVYPLVNLPPYNEKRNILDQLIYAEQLLQKKGKYSSKRIQIENYKQLALLILLAIKEKLYSSDIINYSLDFEIGIALKKYDPFIERIETNNYEKDATDLSRIKYILNSPYWLKRELGNYARNEENYFQIGQAYKYIVNQLVEFSNYNEYKRRKMCRDLILFDIMNEIFLDKYQGNLKLIVYVYTELQEFLASDSHFLHQKAKCYLNYSYYLREKDTSESLKYLKQAKELTTISKSMIEDQYDRTANERLQITLAHTQYTYATITCGICLVGNYLNISDVEEAINAITIALLSPYNNEDYQRTRIKRTSYGIHHFLEYCIQNYHDLNVSRESREKMDNLIDMYFKH